MGFLYKIGIRLINFIVFFLILVYLPGLPPKTHFDFKEFRVSPLRELKGSLELNNHLDNGERLLDGRVYGPECLIVRNNEIFTTIHGGEVIKITSDHITHVAKFGQPCEGIYEEAKCGRPLGLAFDTIGNNLIVADAYYGIWLVDITNGKKKQLISQHQILDGKIKRKAKIFNSVAVDKNGNIYWTDSSSDFTIEDGIFTLLANPSGRLFYYDRVKNESKMLIDELYFPNGLALSPNEDFIIVAETGSSRLLKFYLNNKNYGKLEVFADGLPGNPDNLTPDINGIWVPLVTSSDANNPFIFHTLSRFPKIRLFLLRFLTLLELPFKFINNLLPTPFTQKVIHFIGHFESSSWIFPKRTTILRFDWNGNIIGSLHGFDKSVRFVSHVLELNDSLLLGSPFNKHLGKVKLPRGGTSSSVRIQNVRYESASTTDDGDSSAQIKTSTTTTTTTASPRRMSTTTTPRRTTTSTTTTTTTTPRPKTTTRTTTTSTTTTTPKPKTTTTIKSTTTTTTPKPTVATTTTPIPSSATPKVDVTQSKTSSMSKTHTQKQQQQQQQQESKPAPIKENIQKDTTPPPQPKLKVIKRGGEQGEL